MIVKNFRRVKEISGIVKKREEKACDVKLDVRQNQYDDMQNENVLRWKF